MNSKKIMNYMIWILFLIYLILLIKVILFKYPLSMIISMMSNPNATLVVRLQGSNFIPFKTIIYYISGNEGFRIAIANIIGNIVAFIPLGFLLPIIFKRMRKLPKIILTSFSVSLLFEVIQLLIAIGSFDIDDILLNVFGSLIGYIFYILISKNSPLISI